MIRLSVQEMLGAALSSDMRGASDFVLDARALAQDLGLTLAQHLEIQGPTYGCSFDPHAFPPQVVGEFMPAYAGQPMCPSIAEFNPPGDWVARSKVERSSRDVYAAQACAASR